MSTGLTANRTYKSTMFIMLFEDKKNLLELYNAISGKNYTDSEMLEINTLENAIYMTMKNDISFLIDGRLSLYEHQSTDNPNLPLRFLFYISKLYAGMTRNENLYGTRIVQIPPPEFVVFYNGKDELPDRMERKISDMYAVSDPHAGLELTAVMLNIAGEHNRELKDACRTLGEYAVYTDKIRRYVDEMELADAVERAIQECISEGVLKDFLEKHRAEAKEMSIFEYDQEKHMRQEREAAWEDGLNNGIMLTKQVLQLSARGKSIEEIARECSISAEQVKRILE
ncbi:MAG TPA: hypothetical protein H9730_12375 [Candidatus Mediterraneibacter stercoripullorum]|nr:hypothetical protein [Candidatus Mediterraneibacter stercoripullorum]